MRHTCCPTGREKEWGGGGGGGGGVVDGCGGLCIKQRVNRAAFNLLNKDS